MSVAEDTSGTSRPDRLTKRRPGSASGGPPVVDPRPVLDGDAVLAPVCTSATVSLSMAAMAQAWRLMPSPWIGWPAFAGELCRDYAFTQFKKTDFRSC